MNAQITYSLSSEISNEAVTHHDQEFVINPQTGAITTNKLLDRETMSGEWVFVDLDAIFSMKVFGFNANEMSLVRRKDRSV